MSLRSRKLCGVTEGFLLPRVSLRAHVNSRPIFKSIGLMYSLQIFRIHVEAVQSERWSLPDRRQSPYMAPCKFSMRYVCPHDVAGLKSHETFAPRSVAYGKAEFIG